MKKISVYVASTDAGGNKVKTPLDKQFSILNAVTKQASVMDTLFVDITGFHVSSRRGILRIEVFSGRVRSGREIPRQP